MPISRQIKGALQDSQTRLNGGSAVTHSIHDNENRWSADLKESPNTMFDSEQQVIYSSVGWRLAADWSCSNVGARHSSRSLQTPGDPRWCWDRTSSELQQRFCKNTWAVKVSLWCSNGVKWNCIWKQMDGSIQTGSDATQNPPKQSESVFVIWIHRGEKIVKYSSTAQRQTYSGLYICIR